VPQIVPIKALKDTSGITELCHSSDEPVFITKNGYGSMVIMSMAIYEKTMLLQDVFAKLDVAEREIAEGKTKDARDSLRKLRQKHGI
jgi:PHD/YefM family antitoxin component YafN of YafNO toxin-antitoxin module